MPFEGVFSVLPTPFRGGGEVDIESLKRVVDLIVGTGVNGVTALGVTGEAARLTERERGVIVDAVVRQVAGRVKVIVGASADGVRTCIDFSRDARSLGASAVMVSPPRMPKLNSESVVNHYKALAEAVDLPIVVQDYPPISGFTMEPAFLARIAREIPRARTIKLEDPPTPFKTSRIIDAAGDIGCQHQQQVDLALVGAGADVSQEWPDGQCNRERSPCQPSPHEHSPSQDVAAIRGRLSSGTFSQTRRDCPVQSSC